MVERDKNGRFVKGVSSWNKGLIGENNPLYGKQRNPEIFIKMIETKKKKGNLTHTKETKQKISKSLMGRNPNSGSFKTNHIPYNKGKKSTFKIWNKGLKGKENPLYGIKKPVEFSKQLSQRLKKQWKDPSSSYNISDNIGMCNKNHSKKARENMSIYRKGKTYEELYGEEKSKNAKNKLRKSIKNKFKKYGITNPCIGKYETKLLDALENIYDTKFERQFYVDGYFVDAYSLELNLVIEIDEPRHYDFDNELKQEDKIRQQNIEKSLNCEFIRIKIPKNIYYKNNNIENTKIKMKNNNQFEVYL